MDRPFREVHELYKILYERAEAQQAAEKARQEKEAEEERKKRQADKSKPPQFVRQPPSDAITSKSTITEPSPFELEALEDVLEEIL